MIAQPAPHDGPVVALSGGVGGAKLAHGLDRVLPAGALTVIANTGDDFEHLGLYVAPDLDTVLYTLAGLADRRRGWGRAGETWTFMDALAALGGEIWFRLGDGDLATHVERTRRMRAGEPLSAVTESFRLRLGVRARLLPPSDDPVRTVVHTDAGPLPFQHYFVRERCRPSVTGFEYRGADAARPCAPVLEALADPRLRAVVICPSNPYISIDPILAVPGIREALARVTAPVVAVSPIVGGAALKGPAAKMMRELGLPSRPATVAAHYGELLDGFVLDRRDAAERVGIGVPVEVAQTLMSNDRERAALARAVLAFADRLRAARAAGASRSAGTQGTAA